MPAYWRPTGHPTDHHSALSPWAASGKHLTTRGIIVDH